ncbi:MAG TPA: hypothetical protein QF730_09850 [Planctomycetota bacterium]|nr:hypothetical protein [Planctomycetota bacterium]
MQKPTPRAPRLPLVLILSGTVMLTLALSGCQGYSVPWSGAIYEDEPNGLACCPDNMGTLYVGESMHIRGSVDDCCIDVFDGFAFTPADLCTVQFTLDADSAFADLDLGLYDPWTGSFTAIFDSPYNPEFGSFLVLEPGRPFHLVVSSYSGDSSYSLRVDCLPFNYGPAADTGGGPPSAVGALAQASESPGASGASGQSAKLLAADWDEYLQQIPEADSLGAPTDADSPRLWLFDEERGELRELSKTR